jgi:hypothetical protein
MTESMSRGASSRSNRRKSSICLTRSRNNSKMKSRRKSRRTPSSRATSRDWLASFWRIWESMWEASTFASRTPSSAGATKPSILVSLQTRSPTQWPTTGLWGLS